MAFFKAVPIDVRRSSAFPSDLRWMPAAMPPILCDQNGDTAATIVGARYGKAQLFRTSSGKAAKTLWTFVCSVSLCHCCDDLILQFQTDRHADTRTGGFARLS